MIPVVSELRRHLKERGLSLTKPRQIVFNALRGREPMTMRELVAACSDIDRASVYRTVDAYERAGVIQRLQIGWKYKLELTDTFSHHHHHITCLKCGRIISFDESDSIEKELRRIADAEGFEIQSHQLEIQGLCPVCRTPRTEAAEKLQSVSHKT